MSAIFSFWSWLCSSLLESFTLSAESELLFCLTSATAVSLFSCFISTSAESILSSFLTVTTIFFFCSSLCSSFLDFLTSSLESDTLFCLTAETVVPLYSLNFFTLTESMRCSFFTTAARFSFLLSSLFFESFTSFVEIRLSFCLTSETTGTLISLFFASSAVSLISSFLISAAIIPFWSWLCPELMESCIPFFESALLSFLFEAIVSLFPSGFSFEGSMLSAFLTTAIIVSLFSWGLISSGKFIVSSGLTTAIVFFILFSSAVFSAFKFILRTFSSILLFALRPSSVPFVEIGSPDP